MLIPIFLPHFGCKTLCTYCNQGYITDVKRLNIGKMIRNAIGEKRESLEIGLYGGNILGLEKFELKKLFGLFDDYMELIDSMRLSTKPEKIDREVIEILRKYRVKIIELGVPTFNDHILEALGRHHTVKDLVAAYDLLRNEGFECALQVMVGLPNETFEDIRNMVFHLHQLKPYYLRIYPLVILKDTPLYRAYTERVFFPLSLEEGLRRTLFIYLSAIKEGIRVVKVGLTENETLKEKVAAGLYHPCFGSLLRDEAFFRAISFNIEKQEIEGNVEIFVDRSDVSHLSGYKAQNAKRFKEINLNINIKTEKMQRGEFLIKKDERVLRGHITDALSCSMFQS